MATQQSDALDLSCESEVKMNGIPESLHPCFQQDANTLEEVHTPHGTREEIPEQQADYDVAAGPAVPSASDSASARYDSGDNDLADLYCCFGAYAATAQYVEFAQEDDAHRASGRWPLLVELGAPCKASNKNGESC